MRVTIYDDKWSLLHTFFGFISGLLDIAWITLIAYVIYEAIEYFWRNNHFMGDIIEFMIGLALSELVKEILFVLSCL